MKPVHLLLLCTGLLLTAFQQGAGAAESGSSSPREYIVKVWDTDSGLPQSTITSIAQTPDGYLWIGTMHGGLARFDGERFSGFHPGNTPEFKSIEVQKLLVDSQGTLWISFVEGILFSYRNGHFQFERENLQTPQNWLADCLKSQTNEAVFSSPMGAVFRRTGRGGTNYWETLRPGDEHFGASCCMDGEGTVWCRTAEGRLGCLRGTNFAQITEPPGLRSPRINALLIGGDGRLWVGTDKELAVWNGEVFQDMTPTNGEPNLAVSQLAACRDGSFWVRTEERLRKCKERCWIVADAWGAETKPPTRSSSLLADSHGDIWVSHHEGLWHVGSDGRVSPISEKEGLPSGVVNCMYEDREGNLWLGLASGGLACVRPRVFHVAWPSGPVHLSAKTVCEGGDGTMWFGTSANNFIRWGNGHADVFRLPAESPAVQDTTVSPDGTNRLWVGGVQSGVCEFQNGGFSRPFPSEQIRTVARVLYTDRSGALWIGNEFGLFRWSGGKLKCFTQAEGFTPAYILAITEDREGALWFGTAIGQLRRYKDGRFEEYLPKDSLTDKAARAAAAAADPMRGVGRGALSAGGERFWALYADEEGVVWVGTLGGGLLRFKEGEFTRYLPRHGLPSEHVSQILEDSFGRLWLGTHKGVARVSKAALTGFASGEQDNLTFITFGNSDGLPAVECAGGSQPACWRGRDGRLWFTTVKGAVWVDPNELPSNTLPPPVHIEGISVDGNPMSAGGRTPPHPGSAAPAELRVPAGRHYFEFKFTALSLTSPDKVQFKWRLAGLENNWVDGGTRRGVSYSFIPPGDYQFQVQACNNDGVWNETGAEMQLTVLPYFWQTWWFRGLAAVLALLALGGIYYVRVARLKALERLRLRIARDLHDEVGANLASISLISQLMEISPSAADATQVRGIAVQTIDTLRDIIWFIDPQHDRMSDLIARLKDTARVMLAKTRYTFEQTGDFPSTHLPLPFRRNVPMIFKEALHNLLKHSKASEAEIWVSHKEGRFSFRIKDNGIGFEEGARSSGNGLKNMRRRAAEIGGTLTISSQPGAGTAVTFTAPITQTRDWWKLKGRLSSGASLQ